MRHIVMIHEIQLLKQSISAMGRKWIVHWCLSWAIIMEENVLIIYYAMINDYDWTMQWYV